MEDAKVEKFDGKRQVVWDASSLEAFKKCPRYYDYYVNQRLRTRGAEKVSSHWGTGFHHGVEHFYRGLHAGMSRDDAIANALVEAGKWLEENTLGEGDNSRTNATLLRSIVWYADTWADEPYRTLELPDGEPALETRFEVPIPGTEYRISGRIDRVALFDDIPTIIDFKTTGKALNIYYFKNFKPNIQTYTYPWAYRKLFGVIPTMMIDACQLGVSFNRYSRYTLDFTDSELDEFEEELICTVEHAELLNRRHQMPKNEAGCSMYGGCLFQRVCSQAPEFRNNWLEEDFEVRERKI